MPQHLRPFVRSDTLLHLGISDEFESVSLWHLGGYRYGNYAHTQGSNHDCEIGRRAVAINRHPITRLEPLRNQPTGRCCLLTF